MFFDSLSTLQSVDETQSRLIQKVNSLFDLDSSPPNASFWRDLLTKRAILVTGKDFVRGQPIELPSKEDFRRMDDSQKSELFDKLKSQTVNANNFESVIEEKVNAAFPSVESLRLITGQSERIEAFMGGVVVVKPILTKILKTLYLQRFIENVNLEQKQELVFKGVAFTLLEKIKAKFDEFRHTFNTEIKEQFESVRREVEETETLTRETHFTQIVSLMDALMHPTVGISPLVERLIRDAPNFAQRTEETSLETVTHKVQFVLELFKEVCESRRPENYMVLSERLKHFGDELLFDPSREESPKIEVRRSILADFMRMTPDSTATRQMMLEFAQKVLKQVFRMSDFSSENFNHAITLFSQNYFAQIRQLENEDSNDAELNLFRLNDVFYLLSNDWNSIDKDWFVDEFLGQVSLYYVDSRVIETLVSVSLFEGFVYEDIPIIDRYEAVKMELLLVFASMSEEQREEYIDRSLMSQVRDDFKEDPFFDLFLFLNGVVSIQGDSHSPAVLLHLREVVKSFYPMLAVEALAYRKFEITDEQVFVDEGRSIRFVNIYEGKKDPNWTSFLELQKAISKSISVGDMITHYVAFSYFLTKNEEDGSDVDQLDFDKMNDLIWEIVTEEVEMASSDASGFSKSEIEIMKQKSSLKFQNMKSSIQDVQVRDDDKEYDGRFDSLSKQNQKDSQKGLLDSLKTSHKQQGTELTDLNDLQEPSGEGQQSPNNKLTASIDTPDEVTPEESMTEEDPIGEHSVEDHNIDRPDESVSKSNENFGKSDLTGSKLDSRTNDQQSNADLGDNEDQFDVDSIRDELDKSVESGVGKDESIGKIKLDEDGDETIKSQPVDRKSNKDDSLIDSFFKSNSPAQKPKSQHSDSFDLDVSNIENFSENGSNLDDSYDLDDWRKRIEEEDSEDKVRPEKDSNDSTESPKGVVGDQLRKNLIHSIKGALSAEEIEEIENAPDLVKFVKRMKRVEDPVTGEITVYHLTYVIPANSKCKNAWERKVKQQ